MSSRLEDVGATELEAGVLTVQIGDNDDPVWDGDEEVPVISSLGLCSIPFPANADGAPQALILDTQSDTFIAGIRDTRCVAQNSDLAHGDTRIHTVGPNSADCMVTLRESSKSVEIESETTVATGDVSVGGALSVGGAAGEVALESKLTAALNTLKSAIGGAATLPNDGGATFKAAIMTALSAWPPDLKCTNIKGDG